LTSLDEAAVGDSVTPFVPDAGGERGSAGTLARLPALLSVVGCPVCCGRIRGVRTAGGVHNPGVTAELADIGAGLLCWAPVFLLSIASEELVLMTEGRRIEPSRELVLLREGAVSRLAACFERAWCSDRVSSVPEVWEVEEWRGSAPGRR